MQHSTVQCSSERQLIHHFFFFLRRQTTAVAAAAACEMLISRFPKTVLEPSTLLTVSIERFIPRCTQPPLSTPYAQSNHGESNLTIIHSTDLTQSCRDITSQKPENPARLASPARLRNDHQMFFFSHLFRIKLPFRASRFYGYSE